MPGSTGSGTQAVSGFSTVTGGLTIIMKRIILTGGGTAGHVTPNMALMPELKKDMTSSTSVHMTAWRKSL